MTEIISVRFRPGSKQYYFDPMGQKVPEGTSVIVETGKGLEFGTCVHGNTMIEDEAVVQPLRPLIRIANSDDIARAQENRKLEAEALRLCKKLISQHKLDMKLVSVEYSFDATKVIFFFTAENRVDFRSLVKDLAGTLHSRIELRQIGVRDEARILGGFGSCGKPFCCSQFLGDFQPVSIKMAKTQNLSLNPTKISGTCGRLMCCLKYEQDAYEDAMKRCPKVESFVECPDGVGTITAVNLLKETVKVKLEDSTEQPRNYLTSEIRIVRNGKGKRPEDYVAPPPEELEQLRDPQAEMARTGRVGGQTVSLSEALDQFLGIEPQEEQSGDKRERGKPRRKKEAPVSPMEKAKPAKAKVVNERPAVRAMRQAAARQEAAQQAQTPQAPQQAPASSEAPRRRPPRPRRPENNSGDHTPPANPDNG